MLSGAVLPVTAGFGVMLRTLQPCPPGLTGPRPPLGPFSPLPALTPRAGCRWSRGRCRCPPAAPPASPGSSAPAGRTGSTARSRCGPRRCSRWRTWQAGPRSRSCSGPVPIPAQIPIPVPSRSSANGHAPTCQFEFPTAPSHWVPQATPTPLKNSSGTTPPACLLVERGALSRFYWSALLSLTLSSRPCAALRRRGGAAGAKRREEGAGSSWARRRLIGCGARRSRPALPAYWPRCWVGRGAAGRCGGPGGGRQRPEDARLREAAPQCPGNRPARLPDPGPSRATPRRDAGSLPPPAPPPPRRPQPRPPPGPPHASSPRRPHCSSRAGCGSGGCCVYLFLPPLRASSAGGCGRALSLLLPPFPRKTGKKYELKSKDGGKVVSRPTQRSGRWKKP